MGSTSLLSSVSCSRFSTLHHFLNIRRSVTLIGLKFLHDFFHKLSFVRLKKSPNQLTRCPLGTTALRGGDGPPCRLVEAMGLHFTLIPPPKNHIYYKIILCKNFITF